jgi:hypothetical protein
LTAHRAYPAAAKDQFPYADWGGGDGAFCVVRKCKRLYRRGYTVSWWSRWHIQLFKTEELAEANLRMPCGDNIGGHSREPYCTQDHFIFNLALAQAIKRAEPKKEAIVSPVEPDRQGSLF